MQHIFLQSRGEEAIKGVELFKQECYKYAKEAILLLGAAQDHDFLDKEGSRLLDFAMIDYLRETNDLGHCQRCLLCHRKVKLKRSHVYPKSILKDIAADLISGKDHKVFSTMIGKMVKKSAGEATYGMLCGQCEQCLSQNGENQFSEQVHHKICVKRKVVKDELRLTYGSWLYDFCVGILFRSIAVSTVFIEFERSISDLYKMFCFCRKHLLSLTTNVSSLKPQQSKPLPTVGEQSLAPDQPLRICFFVNPTISSSCQLNLEYVLKAPATFINPVSLCEGIYSHDRRMSTVLVRFDRMNILFQSQTDPNLVMHEYIVDPHSGVLILPKEYKRWQAVPTGVWKLFSAIAQASANLSNLQVKSADGGGKEESNIVTKLNLVYSPENIIGLNQSRIFSLLPLSYKQQLDSSNRVTITFPSDHQVLVKATRQWNYQQEITLFVTETLRHFLCLVFIISVPGWHIIDGLFLDMYCPTVKLPFLNGKTEECHPLECSVIQGMMEEVREIPDYIQIRTQLS